MFLYVKMDPNNMLFRLEDLTAEKVYAEYGITKEERMKNPEFYKLFVEDFVSIGRKTIKTKF